MKQKYKVIDCFCGAGGLSLGFEKAGFSVIYAFDMDEAAINTYNNKHNHKGHGYVRDIYNVSKKSIERDLGHEVGEVDVVIGGPPCQGFSVQRRGDDNDPRNNLVLEYIRMIIDIKPRFFVMENVGGLLSPRGLPYLTQLTERLEEAGYTIQRQKLIASEFGVPQSRKRVFIVGERKIDGKPSFSFPVPAGDPERTVCDAIADLMDKDENDVPNHKSDRLSPINLKRIQAIKEGEGRDSLPEELQLNCHKKNITHRHLDTYGRMAWNKPSPTITARFDSFSRGRFGHPVLDRTITLREGARLQTFPDDFEFLGTKVEVARQIGNAVPPLLAERVAEKVKECL
ncbi:DNA-methyltransferase Dcm [Clostridium sp. ASBs410]|nr:DNA-methyltransferase Dcm [Clostridium sp. ASBs410]